MKLFVLIIIIFLCAPGFAQEESESRHTTFSSGNVSLTASCDYDGACIISINGKMIKSEFYHMGEVSPLFERLHVSAEDIFLMNLDHGDGCPVMYAVVHLIGREKVYISEPFGNCNEMISTVFEDKGILFKFPKLEEALRNEVSYLYSFAKKKIIEVN